MVRARPSQNHGEEIHMVLYKQTLLDLEELLFLIQRTYLNKQEVFRC
jgi:hypothetical protein